MIGRRHCKNGNLKNETLDRYTTVGMYPAKCELEGWMMMMSKVLETILVM